MHLPAVEFLSSDAFRSIFEFSATVGQSYTDHESLSTPKLAEAVRNGGPQQFHPSALPKIGARLTKAGHFSERDAVAAHHNAITSQPASNSSATPNSSPTPSAPAGPVSHTAPAYQGVLSPNRKKAVTDFANHYSPTVQQHVAKFGVHQPGLSAKESYKRASQAYDAFHAERMGVPLASPEPPKAATPINQPHPHETLATHPAGAPEPQSQSTGKAALFKRLGLMEPVGEEPDMRAFQLSPEERAARAEKVKQDSIAAEQAARAAKPAAPQPVLASAKPTPLATLTPVTPKPAPVVQKRPPAILQTPKQRPQVETPAEPLPEPKFGYSTHTAPEKQESLAGHFGQQPSTHGRFAALLHAAKQGNLKEHIENGLGNFFDKFDRHSAKFLNKYSGKLGLGKIAHDPDEDGPLHFSRTGIESLDISLAQLHEFARKSAPGQLSLFEPEEISKAASPKSKARNLRKPLHGQKSFGWDEESHPREKAGHDGKRAGEFAPKDESRPQSGQESRRDDREMEPETNSGIESGHNPAISGQSKIAVKLDNFGGERWYAMADLPDGTNITRSDEDKGEALRLAHEEIRAKGHEPEGDESRTPEAVQTEQPKPEEKHADPESTHDEPKQNKSLKELINEALGRTSDEEQPKQTAAQKKLEKLEQQRVDLNKQGANSRSAIVSKQRKRSDLDEKIQRLRAEIKISENPEPEKAAEPEAKEPTAIEKQFPSLAGFVPPQEESKESPDLVRFGIDIDRNKMFANGQKRGGFSAQSISMAALKGANAIWHHQGDPNQTLFNAAQQDPHESTSQSAKEIKAAKAAGYRLENHRAGKYGTLWVFAKDGRVLTERGAKSLVDGSGKAELDGDASRETLKPTIEAVDKFFNSLPDSTKENLGALTAALNRSPLGKHVKLSRDDSGTLRLSGANGKWHIHEPTSGHDKSGNWHQTLESSLPRFLDKIGHMAKNDIPPENGGWAVHDRSANEHAVSNDSGLGTKQESPAAAKIAEQFPSLAQDIPKEQSKPKGPLTLSDLAERAEKIHSGKATAGDVRQWFADLDNPEHSANIKAELSKKSVDELKKMGAQGFYGRQKKADLIESLMDSLGDEYNVSGGLSFAIGGGFKNSKKEALRKKIESQTDEDIAKHASDVAARRAEYRERFNAYKKAIDNPETLDEFKTFLRTKKESDLTPEQQEKYDDLMGRTRREKEAEKKSVVSAASDMPEGLTSEYKQGHHAKKNKPTHVVTINQRVEKDKYNELLGKAKALGGYYSSFKGSGAIPGFQFDSEDAAKKFQDVVSGKDVDRSDILGERTEKKQQEVADSLRDKADAIRERAEEGLNKDRKTNTARRADMAASIDARNRQAIAHAKTITQIADKIGKGEATHLSGVRAATHIEQLERSLHRAKLNSVREKDKDKSIGWKDREEMWNRPPSAEDIAHAEYPHPKLWQSELQQHAKALADVPGLKLIAQRLAKKAKGELNFSSQGNGFKFNGGQIVDPFTLDALKDKEHLVPELKGKHVRVHASYDWRLSKEAPGHHGAFYTANKGKSFSTTPSAAIITAINKGTPLDTIEPKEDKMVTIDDPREIANLATAASRLKNHSNRDLRRIGESLASDLEQHNRLQSMGIKNLPELRAAMREFIALRHEKEHEDPVKAAERGLVGKKIDGFFPTPKTLVNQMLDSADIGPGMSVLEPSAGKGDILDAIKERHGDDVATEGIEPHSSLRDILTKKGHNVVAHDFMEHPTDKKYDRIIMNPPFERGQDAEHVQKAYEHLKPGGRLVAVMSEGPFNRSDKKSEAFRDWLEQHDGESETLPEGSFKTNEAFRHTGVNTRMVVLHKPDGGTTQEFSRASDALSALKSHTKKLKNRWPQSKRDKTTKSDFAGPHESFPIKTEKDVESASKLIGHAANPGAVKSRVKSIAKSRGLKIPKAWK